MSVFAPTLNYIWKSAKDFGFDAQKLFEEANIDPALRHDINARIPSREIDDLLSLAESKSKDESFAFNLARQLHPSYLGALGYAWLTSANLRKAFERLSRYARLVNDETVIRIGEFDGEFHVIVASDETECRDPALRERLRLAALVRMCRGDYGEGFVPTRVHFQQPSPSTAHLYFEYFRCKLVFDSKESILVIPSSVADEKLAGFNPQLVQQFDQMIVEYLARHDRQDIVSRTRAAILDQLPSGGVSLESTAESLNMAARTLTRKLHDQDHAFKRLLANTRRDLAEKYILDKSLTLTEISFLLGFSETSSFSRAYRSWTGESPRAHRQSLMNAP